MAMTYPDALAVAAPESLAFASPASVKRLAIDVAVSTIESSFFLPLASARTIVGAEARRALLSPLFITLNGALILALARTIGAVDREEFLAFSRTRNSGLMQLARQSAFDAQTRECIEYVFFTAQRRVEEVLEQQPSVRVSSPNLLYRGLRAANDVELLQGVLVYALDHPHRIRNKRVIGALSEKGVEAVDVHLLLLGQMGFEF